nr:hypothetical protein [Actinomycetota bacterium]
SGGTGAGPVSVRVGGALSPLLLTTTAGRSDGPAVHAASRATGTNQAPRPTLTAVPPLTSTRW